MRRLGILIVALLLAVSTPQAQTAPKIAWTHSGVNVTHFQLQIAANWIVDMGLPTPTGSGLRIHPSGAAVRQLRCDREGVLRVGLRELHLAQGEQERGERIAE